MNPHFIFNSLGSIQKFLLENDSNNADYYLSKFAQLIRLILSSSRKNHISIEDEIKLLKLYLDLEKRRMDNAFSYEFIIEKNIQKESTYISPMLIQPLLENSIWHGIAHLTERKGHIRIEFGLIDDYIVIYIEDNGIGFNHQAEKNNDNERGDGISIIRERIEIMKKIHNDKDISIHFIH
jgi:LytS/YehU family sensor histidine kinase